MRKTALLFSFLLLCLAAPSQKSAKADSLRNALKTRPADTTRVLLLCDLAWELRQSKPEEALQLTDEANRLSSQLRFARGKAKALRIKGILHRISGDYTNAILSLKEAVRLSDSLHDQKNLGDSYNSLGEAYRNTGDWTEAMKNYQAALDIFTRMNDKKSIALVKNNLGIIYYNEEKFDKALTLYLESLQLRRDVKDQKGVAQSLNNIANVYGRMNDNAQSLRYHSESLALNRQMKNDAGVALSLQNIGVLHTRNNEPELALAYYDSSLVIFSALNDSVSIATTMVKIGQAYVDMKKMADGKRWLENALAISTRMNLRQTSYYAAEGLNDLYLEQKKYPEAYRYLQLMFSLRDSLLGESNLKQMNELEARYETKQKQAEIEMLSQKNRLGELEQQRTEEQLHRTQYITYTVLAGGALVMVLLFVLYNRYQIKRKANVELEQKNLIIEGKNKNITDSINYAQRIQKALLASDALLKQNLGEHFVYYQPKDIVSGDFYWATRDGNLFFLAAADCTGHGVPGAFMSLLNITYLNAAVIEKRIQDPSLILAEVRRRLIHSLQSDAGNEGARDGMDATLLLFDKSSNSISFACANNPLLLVRNGELTVFGPDKFPVGIHPGSEEQPFTLHRLDVQKGDCIYLLSDGYADQFGGPKQKKFMFRQLTQHLLSMSTLPMQAQHQELRRLHEEWRGSLEQVDDILLIGIRF